MRTFPLSRARFAQRGGVAGSVRAITQRWLRVATDGAQGTDGSQPR